MGIYTAKQWRSRTDSRKNYKFPDYLLNNSDFMSLMEQKIRDRLDSSLEYRPINKSKKYRNTRWKIYDSHIEVGKNKDVIYLELLYNIINDILDAAILFQDWDRIDRFNKEKKIRKDINDLKLESKNMNSISYNIEHQRLSKQLEEIMRQKRELRETNLREKY